MSKKTLVEQLQEDTQQAGKKRPAALAVASQHAWHLWHGTDAGRRVSPTGLRPSVLRILQLPDTTPPRLPTAICLSGRISFHACRSTQRHLTPSLLCSLFYWKGRGGGVLKGDSTLMRGQTDGLCVWYLQPEGDWGNLAVVAEVRSQGSRAKAPQNVIKIKCRGVLGEGVVAGAHRKAVVYTLSHSFIHFINSSSKGKKPGLHASSGQERRNGLFFFFFSPRDPRKEWTHRKDMFVLWWNASYLFLFLLTSLIATSCSRDATANQNLPLCLVTGFKHSTQATRGAKISTYSHLTLLQLRPTEKRLNPGEKP